MSGPSSEDFFVDKVCGEYVFPNKEHKLFLLPALGHRECGYTFTCSSLDKIKNPFK